jgi:hypothetical protein
MVESFLVCKIVYLNFQMIIIFLMNAVERKTSNKCVYFFISYNF